MKENKQTNKNCFKKNVEEKDECEMKRQKKWLIHDCAIM